MNFNLDFGDIPGLLNLLQKAATDGAEWGQQFLDDPRWHGCRRRMANHAIYEATLWSIGTGVAAGTLGLAGIPLALADSLYSHLKLSAALFTIYGVSTSQSMFPVLLSAAAGSGLSDLAARLGTRAAGQAIEKALFSAPLKVLMKINRDFALKLIPAIGGKSAAKALKIIPAVGCVISGSTNAVMMNACGHSVLAFLDKWNDHGSDVGKSAA